MLGVHSVLETSIFTRSADALLTTKERNALIDALASDPAQGDLVPGLGGIRKMRFAASGRGKSGAFRVIYYLASEAQPIFAMFIYGKNEQAKPTPEQIRVMLAAVAGMKKRAQAQQTR